MTLNDLVEMARRGEPPPELGLAAFGKLVDEAGITHRQFFDQFSVAVRNAFLNGTMSWDFGDVAMNRLFAFAMLASKEEMSDLCWGVYLAFDDAEFRHKGDAEHFDHTLRTRDLLSKIPNL